MPIYEFRCARCGKLAEVVQRVGERSPPCPHCGSKRMSRAVSRTSFHLKGGGWHADLYATPRPAGDKAEGAEIAKPPAEQPAAPARPDDAAKPATPPATAPGAKPGAIAAAPRRTPRPPRKRR
jgi:putative FmdB family regulatory protein